MRQALEAAMEEIEAEQKNVFALMTQNRRVGVDVSAETCIPDWSGEVMDGDMVVGALLEFER